MAALKGTASVFWNEQLVYSTSWKLAWVKTLTGVGGAIPTRKIKFLLQHFSLRNFSVWLPVITYQSSTMVLLSTWALRFKIGFATAGSFHALCSFNAPCHFPFAGLPGADRAAPGRRQAVVLQPACQHRAVSPARQLPTRHFSVESTDALCRGRSKVWQVCQFLQSDVAIYCYSVVADDESLRRQPSADHEHMCTHEPGFFSSVIFCSDISVICLTVVVKLAVTVFISLYFQTFFPKWLNFFPSFKNISAYDREKQHTNSA